MTESTKEFIDRAFPSVGGVERDYYYKIAEHLASDPKNVIVFYHNVREAYAKLNIFVEGDLRLNRSQLHTLDKYMSELRNSIETVLTIGK